MLQRSTLLAFALLIIAMPLTACGQSTYGDAERKARIIANLQHSIAQLKQAPMTVTSIESGSGTFDKGILNIAGQQNISFLVSKDNTEFYLLASEAIDVSLSKEELDILKEEEERAMGAEALERAEMLSKASVDAPRRGNPDAPITIIEFSDFQCPYCARATTVVDQVLAQYGDEVQLVYMHLPLESIHPWAMNAAITASCAAKQDNDAFWTLHDYYFENQSEIDLNNLATKSREAVGQSGIDLASFSACVQKNETRGTVISDQSIGASLGLTGTPAFFVNGRMINGSQPIEHFHDAIRLAKMDAGM